MLIAFRSLHVAKRQRGLARSLAKYHQQLGSPVASGTNRQGVQASDGSRDVPLEHIAYHIRP
jgi:hypothetical protein